MAWRSVAVVVVVAVVLAGCSAEAPEERTAPTRKTPEELYLSTVRTEPSLVSVSDSTLLLAGRETCSALDRGTEPAEVVALAAAGRGTEGSITIVATAVTMLCREHLAAMESIN